MNRQQHDRVVTRAGEHDPRTPRVEIGSTWNALSAQATGTNPDSKLLMLRQAFEVWECPAVEFRTDFHNQQSRAAIARLGAKQDGILQSHLRPRAGYFVEVHPGDPHCRAPTVVRNRR